MSRTGPHTEEAKRKISLGRHQAHFRALNPQSIVTLARKHSSRAIAILAEIMEDKDAPPACRVKAAECIIERGYGKAPIAVTVEDNSQLGLEARAFSVLEKIAMLAQARDASGETVELENSQLKLVEAAPAEVVEDLVG